MQARTLNGAAASVRRPPKISGRGVVLRCFTWSRPRESAGQPGTPDRRPAAERTLRTAGPHLCCVEVAVLVHAELVRSPQPAGFGHHRAPGIEQLPVQVVLVELEIPVAVRCPQVLVRGYVDVIGGGGSVSEVPLAEELAVLIENLDAPVAATRGFSRISTRAAEKEFWQT